MNWKEVGGAIKKYAPMLGAIVGGPAGGAVGGAVSLIASAFGIEGEPSPENIIERITTDPEARIKLREIEVKHKERLQELALQSDSLYIDDRKSARQRQVESEKATGQKDNALYILATCYTVGFFTTVIILVYLFLTGNVPPDIPQHVTLLLGTLIGTLSSATIAVVNYFFGSSKSSSEKTALLVQNNK